MKIEPFEKGLLFWWVVIMILGSAQAGNVAAVEAKDRQPPSAKATLDVVFVLDNSGSMLKNDPKFITRKVVIDFLQGLQGGSRMGMVVFGQKASLAKELTDTAAQGARAGFVQSLGRIDYQGRFTNIPAGVERAIYELKTGGRKDAEKVVILLTDGIVDTGDRAEDAAAEAWLRDELTLESKKAGIRIFGVAFTDQADFRLIQTLSAKTDGEYFRAYRVEDIQGVFQKVRGIIEAPSSKPQAIASPPPPTVRTVAAPAKQPVPESPAAATTVNAAGWLPLAFSVLAVAIGTVVLFLVFKKRPHLPTHRPAKQVLSEDDGPSPPPPVRAEIIDAENILSKDVVSYQMERRSMSIGRDSGNDIAIPFESVSSLHATIEYRNGYFYLEDHRSTNGTFLNDKRAVENQPLRLKSGDKIQFSVYEFRFLLPDQSPYGETVILQKDAEKETSP